MSIEPLDKIRYAVVAAVQLPNITDLEFEASLAELRDLAKTLGYQVVQTFIQKRNAFDASAYLGLGKREEIRDFVNGSAAEDSVTGLIEACLLYTSPSPRD